jgi:hypothetical protein
MIETPKFAVKSSHPVVNSLETMDEKTRQQYTAEAHNILIHSFIITVITGIIWALISPPLSVINPLFIAPVLIFIYIIKKSKLNTKYKITNVYLDPHYDFINNNKIHQFRSLDTSDLDPGLLGSGAWTARQHQKAVRGE